MSEWDGVIDNWYDQALANGQGFKSEEEKQAYLDSLGDPLDHPMFATDAAAIARHPLGDAFRLLKEEDKTPYELAVMYKDEGNEFIKCKTSDDYKNAIDKYDQALPFVDQMEEERKIRESKDLNEKGEKDVQEEKVEEIVSPSVLASQEEEEGKQPEGDRGDNVDPQVLRSQIISNKAAAHLGLKNYRMCINECDLALRAWPGNMKAYYRKAKCLSMLRKFHEVKSTYDTAWAVATGDDALSLPNDLQALYKHANTEIDKEDKLRRQVIEQQVQRRREWEGVWDVCQEMGVSLGFPAPRDKQQQQLRSVFPFYEGASKRPENIRWPCLFLYPQYNELDVVQAAGTDDMLAAHLAVMFPEKEDLEGGEQPVPWDMLGEYQVSKLVVYLTFDGIERVETAKEWKEGCTAYYGEVEGKEEKEAKSQRKGDTAFCEVHMGCTLRHILRCSTRHVTTGGLTTFMTFVRGNPAHKKFLKDQKKAGYAFYLLDPGAPPRDAKIA